MRTSEGGPEESPPQQLPPVYAGDGSATSTVSNSSSTASSRLKKFSDKFRLDGHLMSSLLGHGSHRSPAGQFDYPGGGNNGGGPPPRHHSSSSGGNGNVSGSGGTGLTHSATLPAPRPEGLATRPASFPRSSSPRRLVAAALAAPEALVGKLMPRQRVWHKHEGLPPQGFLWVWMGRFSRWRRRYFVATTPGVLFFYKSAQCDGKAWTISLRAATAMPELNPKQLRIVSGQAQIYLRAAHSQDRDQWISCIRESIDTYDKNREKVSVLQELGLLPAPTVAEEAVGSAGLVHAESITTRTSMFTLPDVADLDADQRRKIRHRVHEQMSRVWPAVTELERQLGVVQRQLMATAGSLSLGTLGSSSWLQWQGGMGGGAPGLVSMTSTPLAATAAAAVAGPHGTSVIARPRSELPDSPAAAAGLDKSLSFNTYAQTPTMPAVAHAPTAAADTEGASASHVEFLAPDEGADSTVFALQQQLQSAAVPSPQSVLLQNSRFAGAAASSAAEAPLPLPSPRPPPLPPSAAGMQGRGSWRRPRGMSLPPTSGAAAASGAPLQVAFSQLIDAVRSSLQAEAMKVVELEGEVFALRQGLTKRASTLRRGLHPEAAARGVAGGVQEGNEGAASDTDSDYVSIGGGDEGDDGPVMRRSSSSSLQEEDGLLSDGGNSAEEGDVLSAMEVVHQVEYMSKHADLTPLTEFQGSVPPPDTAEDEDFDAQSPVDDDDELESVIEQHRTRLPTPKPLGRGFSIWSMLKNAIGGDLTKITMPATINEPLSFLQRIAEVMEYRSLLERMVECPNSCDRLLWMAGYVMSAYNSQLSRESKPFNPLLGETCEWQAPDNKHRFLAEQVSHHPPISAYHADGCDHGYEMYGELETRTKFWGKSIEVILAGQENCRTTKWGDHFVWNRMNITVNDIILGRFWADIYGDVRITNTATGEYALIKMRACRGRLEQRGLLEGAVHDAAGGVVYTFAGSVANRIDAQMTPAAAAARGLTGPPPRLCIFEREPPLEDAAEQYGMTSFAILINEPFEPLLRCLPPTDARFRPDQRFLELGEHATATSEKLRLEDKQRKARRARKEAGEEYNPMWFKQRNPADKEMVKLVTTGQPPAWEFTKAYWAKRSAKEWDGCPDIY